MSSPPLNLTVKTPGGSLKMVGMQWLSRVHTNTHTHTLKYPPSIVYVYVSPSVSGCLTRENGGSHPVSYLLGFLLFLVLLDVSIAQDFPVCSSSPLLHFLYHHNVQVECPPMDIETVLVHSIKGLSFLVAFSHSLPWGFWRRYTIYSGKPRVESAMFWKELPCLYIISLSTPLPSLLIPLGYVMIDRV